VRFHGVETDSVSGRLVLNMGFVCLAGWLDQVFRWPKANPDSWRPEWEQAWFDKLFDQAVSKLRDTTFKIDKVAWHFGRCMRDAQIELRDGMTPEEYGPHLAAFDDAPLYLDMLYVYLRIHADCVASVIPHFYGKAGRGAPRDSWRGHARWFTETNRDLDPHYSEIVAKHLAWFAEIAGPIRGQAIRGQGVRDILVHHRGTYQLGYTRGPARKDFQFTAMVVGDRGIVENDAVSLLRSVVEGYFSYLDAAFVHFRDRFQEMFSPPTAIPLRLYVVEGPPPLSFWLYPGDAVTKG
jgi:hypothetical protein